MPKRHRQPEPLDAPSPVAALESTTRVAPVQPRTCGLTRRDTPDPSRSSSFSSDAEVGRGGYDHTSSDADDARQTSSDDEVHDVANDAAVFDSDTDTVELEEDEMTGDDGNQEESTGSDDLDDSSASDDDGGGDGDSAESDDVIEGEGDSSGKERTRGGGVVTVNFGVYDMKEGQTDAVMHLIDQFCPDHRNEVDRDAFGAMLVANPFTCVVRVNDDEDNDETELDMYGLASIVDLVHGMPAHAAALKPLQKLMQHSVWRTADPGLSPLELLTSTTDPARESGGAGATKCVLLLAEYIRNVPLELTVCILEDLVTRLDTDDDDDVSRIVRAARPCMYAVLAKVQRAVEPPVTVHPSAGAGQRKRAVASPSSGAIEGGEAANREAALDMRDYIFWQEEKSVLYDFRDRRVATLVYRCRAQYDGQPAQEVPLSVLFVLQHGAMRQAIDEMKKRTTAPSDVTRF